MFFHFSSKKSDDELQPRCNTRNLFSKLKECYKDRKIKPRVKDAKKWKRTLSWRSFDKSNNGKRKYSVGASNADACKTISLTSDTETSESRICDGQSSQQHFNNMDTKRKEGEQPLSKNIFLFLLVYIFFLIFLSVLRVACPVLADIFPVS